MPDTIHCPLLDDFLARRAHLRSKVRNVEDHVATASRAGQIVPANLLGPLNQAYDVLAGRTRH